VRTAFRQFGLVLAFSCAAAAAQDRQLVIAPVKPAPAGERRVALVIGNASYKSSPLRNPVKDARAMAEALAATGFKVTVVEDATETAMRRAIRAFGDELLSGGVGLFYYAGHGMQVRGRNYLIPVNADIEREDEVEDQAVDANLVLGKMDSAKNSLNLMILDACRNNPFARAFRSSARGLAQMDAPSGTLVAFATAPGSVASDGDGDNGLYTKHLLANMTRPGLPIEQVFKEVRIGVGQDTGDRQIPWESSSLRGDFFFIAPDPSQSEEARKRELEKAVAEAVRGEQEKLAAQQREMQAMIREMLAKQRAELEEEMRRRAEALGAKPPAAAAPAAKPAAAPVLAAVSASAPASAPSAPLAPEAGPPALDPLEDANDPLHLAAVAAAMPAVSQVDDPRYPKVGDHWEYAYTDVTTRTGSNVNVKILGVASDGILDADDFDSFVLTRRAHGAGAELLILDPIWVFSPYLHVFGGANPGASWSEIESRKDRFCARTPSCSYSAQVLGREKIATRAGSFDAVKVTVDLTAGMGGFYLRRRATFWYAEAAKRLVKSTLRTLSGQTHEPDYDLELVSYKLN
jgi:uncharacterized caspase-like protein